MTARAERVEEADAGLGSARVLDADEVEGVLSGSFYVPKPASPRRPRPAKGESKPLHYKVICISLYTRDLTRLDSLVDELKARGMTKANRSALIRVALDQIDLDKVPRGL
ncbi:MAG: hypothetical protein ACREJ3_13265 [Polyangiaceae bacterium]